MRVLSGIQPSGELHIGNYFGAIRQYLELQNKHECLFFIANYHAMTTVNDAETLKKHTINAALDYLALGLNPDKATIFIQSDIPELTELAWVLSTTTSMGLLERCHSYKDKVAKNITPNHALFAYPVLMAADILMYKSNLVPVGKDQKQHLEVTRDIASKFNNDFKKEIFPLPDEFTPEAVAVIPGTDGQKMSKSYDNTITMFAPEKPLRKKIMSIKTDSKEMEDSKDPETCNIFQLYKHFSTEDQQTDLAKRYRAGGLGYGHAKQELFEALLETFKDARKKREDLTKNLDFVKQVLKDGALKASQIAKQTMHEIYEVTGLKPF